MAELQWNVDQDMNELILEFSDNYFKDASEPMMAYLDAYRAWHAYLAIEENVMGQVVEPGIVKKKFPTRRVK